tara:strand:- start:451 stop:729 length:279 start_codon:yes stop_codon:yes gene_type:complete
MAKKKTFHPNRDWVMLPDPRKSETDSGIILNESTSASLQTNILEVLEAGPTCEFVAKGDTIMVNPSTEGIIIDVDGTSCVLIPEFHILGIMK